jgi:hypothetical protein
MFSPLFKYSSLTQLNRDQSQLDEESEDELDEELSDQLELVLLVDVESSQESDLLDDDESFQELETELSELTVEGL